MNGRNLKSIVNAQVRFDGVAAPKRQRARNETDEYGRANADVAYALQLHDAQN